MATTSPTSPAKAQLPADQDATSPAKPAPQKPVAVFRFGDVSAAVFANPQKLPSGKTTTFLEVSVRKSYRNAQGAWVHGHTLGADDLLPAAYALLKCADFVAESQQTRDE